MPRTLTAYERQIIAAARVAHWGYLEARDADAAWQNISKVATSHDMLVGGSVREDYQQAIGTASFRLRRRDGSTVSLSPLMTSSLANRNAANAFAALLDVGREVRLTACVTRGGAAPGMNALKYSEDFTNAVWTPINLGSRTPNAALAPDGSNTATRITDNATSGAHGLSQPAQVAFADNAPALASWFVKAETLTKATLLFTKKDGSQARVFFDLTGGAASTTIGTGILAYGTRAEANGYTRIWAVLSSVLTGATTPSVQLWTALSMNANGYVGTGQSMLIWGAAFDSSSVLTEYVKTLATAGLTSWREAFYGRIDAVSFDSDPMTIDCSSLDGWLQDTQIETDAVQYGTTPVGTALETVIQNIVNNWHSGKLTGAQETVYTPVSPNFLVTDWSQGRVKVLEAIRTITQQSTGWDLRFRYDAAGASRLTLLDPGRARNTIDDTIGPDEYLDIHKASLALSDIRNVIKVWYVDANGVKQSVTSTSTPGITASINAYGRRYAEVTASSLIKTAATAQTLADAIANDLSYSPLAFTLSTLYHPGVQLYDRHTVTQNNEHFDADQTLAVIAVQHEFQDGLGDCITTIDYANRVSGPAAPWLALIKASTSSAAIVTPYFIPQPSENGVQGQLKLTVVDPQGRLRAADYAIVAANATLPLLSAGVAQGGWTAMPAAVGNVYTLPTFSLADKQNYRVAYRLWGDIGNGWQVIDSDEVRFAVGATPGQPLISPSMFSDGTLSVLVRGDSDTTQIRICVKYDSQPTEAEIDAQTPLDGRSCTQSFGPLANGTRYFIGAKAYNVGAGLASVPFFTSDQWSGPSSSQASVLVGSTAVTDKAVVFNGIVLGPQTTDVRVFVREYANDPGSPVSVRSIGYAPPGTPMKANGSLTVPVAIPGNYIVATFVALDALNREGGTSASGVNVSAGEVTVKVQSATVAPALPVAPALGVAQNGQDGVNVNMTPSSVTNLAAFRIFRDGIALPDVPLTVGAGVTQTYLDAGLTPGSSHTYQVYGVNASGALSAAGSAVSSITLTVTQVPLPTVSYGVYDEALGGFTVSVAPAAGTPAGVTWTVYSRTSLSGTSNPAESSTNTDFMHYRNSVPHPSTDYVKVIGRKTGYTDSAFTAEVAVAIPATSYQ